MTALEMLSRFAALGFGSLALVLSLVNPDLARSRTIDPGDVAAGPIAMHLPVATQSSQTLTSLFRR